MKNGQVWRAVRILLPPPPPTPPHFAMLSSLSRRLAPHVAARAARRPAVAGVATAAFSSAAPVSKAAKLREMLTSKDLAFLMEAHNVRLR